MLEIIGIAFYSAVLIACIATPSIVMSKNEDAKNFWMKWLMRAVMIVVISFIIIIVYAIYMIMTGSFWLQ